MALLEVLWLSLERERDLVQVARDSITLVISYRAIIDLTFFIWCMYIPGSGSLHMYSRHVYIMYT